MRLIDRSTRDERGITLVIFALVLTTLLIFAAFAVDIGAAYNQRRQMQSAADGAALSAAQDLASTSTANTTAQTYSKNTFSPGTNFNSCGGDTPPATIHGIPGTITWTRQSGANCIAFDNSGTAAHLIWVDVPPTNYSTVFAQFAGLKTITTGGTAVAGIKTGGLGGVLPFAIPVTSGPGEGCLKSSSGSHTGPDCTGPVSGNFGFLDFGYYGNAILGTTCQNATGGTLVPNNIAVGVDHNLHTLSQDGGTVVLEQNTSCNSPANPNSVKTKTGTLTSDFDKGMLTGTGFTDGLNSRLTRTQLETTSTFTCLNGTGAGPPCTTSIESTTGVDDTGLWQFIPETTLTQVPTSCQRATFDTAFAVSNVVATRLLNMETQLTNCFSDYEAGDPTTHKCAATPCTGNLFTVSLGNQKPFPLYDIQLSARFGYAPVLTTALPNGSSQVSFLKFRAVYLQELTSQNNSGQSWDFVPGVGDGNQNGNDKAGSISAFIFDPNMLPGTLGTDPFNQGSSQVIQLFK